MAEAACGISINADELADRVKRRKDDDRSYFDLLSAGSLIVELISGPATAAEFATKEQAVAMVKKTVAFIEEQGPDKAYKEISDNGGRFHDRDLYITVLDLNGKVLAHGQNENLIGQDLIETKDPDGKLFVKERVELARQQASFWQGYKFMNPVTKNIEPKQMYCERLNETALSVGVCIARSEEPRCRLLALNGPVGRVW